MAQDPGRGTLILVLGIVSLVCCTLVGPLAWIWGKQDLEKIKRGEISPEAEQMTKIGMILGIVGSVLLILQAVGGCVYIIFVVIIGMAATKAGPIKTALDVFDAVGSLVM